ncbi:MAG: hydroxyacylglutathione hydrolase [Pseudomonadales bacterium]|nr:hydroxyacylglutathione hydrolase [Pseudomonadales bacterium]
MIVEQIWTGNAYRNFNYLIACGETGEALAVDPLDYKKCLALAEQRGWTITQIVNTHEHGDHTGGNASLVAATGARLLAHENARSTIKDMDQGLAAGDVISIGKTVELLALDTPGHTMSHVCLLSQTDIPALFCGDTLFNAGAGNCHNGGHPNELYDTFAKQLATLSPDTLVYPGHDYITNNLEFTLDREPDNAEAAKLLTSLQEKYDPDQAIVTSLAQEQKINTFFRLDNPSVISRLRETFPEMSDKPDEREVFVKLRALRNDW